MAAFGASARLLSPRDAVEVSEYAHGMRNEVHFRLKCLSRLIGRIHFRMKPHNVQTAWRACSAKPSGYFLSGWQIRARVSKLSLLLLTSRSFVGGVPSGENRLPLPM